LRPNNERNFESLTRSAYYYYSAWKGKQGDIS
jgi:hypothetical protein